MERPDWDMYFMSMCYMTALRSRDVHTKVGAIIVDHMNDIISIGYNSLPRGINYEGEIGEDGIPSRLSRINNEKYDWCEHAERNAIYNAARKGARTDGGIAYVTAMPCKECIRGLVQAGVNEVVIHRHGHDLFHKDRTNDSKYANQTKFFNEICDEAGIIVRWYDGPVIGDVRAYFNGECYEM